MFLHVSSDGDRRFITDVFVGNAVRTNKVNLAMPFSD